MWTGDFAAATALIAEADAARTVEWHLRKVFTKLGVSSRRELPGALASLGRMDLPASPQ